MSSFQCDKCGMINIDCCKDGFKTPREIKLEIYVKELEKKLNAQFTEMEEKLTAEEMKNFELKEEIKELKDLNRRLDNQREEYWKGYLKLDKKLKIAEEVLQYLDNTKTLNDLYLKYRVQQALQKMKEVK